MVSKSASQKKTSVVKSETLKLSVFFRRYVQLKSSFSDEKNISGEAWDTLVEKLSKINVAKA